MHTVVRRHRNEINSTLQVQQVAQNGKLASDAKLKKTALATFYVYIVFLGCYVPYFCVRAASIISGESVLRRHLFYYFLTLMYLNSSLNPLVYCWKMRNIRQAVMSVLRNIFFKSVRLAKSQRWVWGNIWTSSRRPHQKATCWNAVPRRWNKSLLFL